MTGKPAPHGAGGPDDGQLAATGAAASAGQPAAEAEGGEAACWAHLVCPECGAVQGEDHREGCGLGAAPPAAR